MRHICTLQSNRKDLSAACVGLGTGLGQVRVHIFTPLASLCPGVPPPAQDPQYCSENLGLVIKGQAVEPGRPVFKFRICTLMKCGAFCKLLASQSFCFLLCKLEALTALGQVLSEWSLCPPFKGIVWGGEDFFQRKLILTKFLLCNNRHGTNPLNPQNTPTRWALLLSPFCHMGKLKPTEVRHVTTKRQSQDSMQAAGFSLCCLTEAEVGRLAPE